MEQDATIIVRMKLRRGATAPTPVTGRGGRWK